MSNSAIRIHEDLLQTDQHAGTHAHGYSVKDLCHRWKVGSDKVHAFLRKGELIAVNVAATLSGRPQWRITVESVLQFERRRSSSPVCQHKRRGRRKSELIDYYSD